MRGVLARVMGVVMVIAAGVAVFAMVGLTWYEHTSGTERSAWEAVGEVSVNLALAGVAGAAGAAALALGVRLPLLLALLGALAALALTALLGYRIGEQPSLPLPFDQYETQSGPLIALVAAGALLAASLIVAVASSTKRCPDCAERISRGADLCPHCGHMFEPRRGWKRCPNCRGNVRQQARVCKHCRHDLTTKTA